MRFFDPSLLRRTYRDPVAWGALVIDLIPIYAVLVIGWGAAPLVFLYWLENLVLGAVLLRITSDAVNIAKWVSMQK